jgi:hypothetical protein
MRIRLGEGRQIANQAIFSIGSRRRFIVNSILSDWEMTPALNFCEVTVFREPLEIFRRVLSSGDTQSGELLADERVSGHALLKRSKGGQAIALCRGPRNNLQRIHALPLFPRRPFGCQRPPRRAYLVAAAEKLIAAIIIIIFPLRLRFPRACDDPQR